MKHATPTDIKTARTVAGHTQTQAAAVLGVSLRTWQHWEHGQVPLRVEQLALYRLATVGPPDRASSAASDRARLESAFLDALPLKPEKSA